ncbi:DUF2059 domain-containing protein [Qipengyuania flava]|uniref:DUF2059 domain-containing protein n=1 Tax=Qipengyuania flava TaxID=192812 RepID=UPI001C58E7DB|nr:DUF2059 domain-containing protein [Qipengyuania flava]MBW3166790.1 DUF2059 domain-containing protein [Qipengyuania flava]MBY5964028.1 DUF2059 domain-containing protein [Qipengyuania flava]MBY6010352.1 DUF2059 domain-containing protein [Qipengyuania flava]MBY6024794.1 DUF2059 domain-containing protein [Qipengyuania flava]
MKKIVNAMAAAALVCAVPAAAQEDPEHSESAMSPGDLDEFAGMMAGLFQTEALTEEQNARLPAAQAVVGEMMPDGFYGEMMAGMMDKMLRPMLTMFSQPEFVLGARLTVDAEAIEALEEAEQAELTAMLDPAYQARGDAMVAVLTSRMGGMFTAMEGPMREGLSKAYAVRFDDAQLADIAAFFATPTGGEYARESMALFADPQVMQASMQALPAMMSGFGDIESAMREAMEALPAERGYGDLTEVQRERMAELLDVDPAQLADLVNPPKSMDDAAGQ